LLFEPQASSAAFIEGAAMEKAQGGLKGFELARHALSESAGLWWVRGSGMMVVQIQRELIAERLVPSHGIFEQLLLNIAR
jgi:hypothetical protein